ncbi:MOSC domain-containing protein [Planococcus lenghuensis]|uniref:MOSC domain-containing protein n=1 Tax=Planococcus lenghuensis TaxID=2213202 RepID=A0A1Q2KZ03_9BACL|nr:MOSC domain-containing protein [Planococcus lenghuensis]AQQ53421.1 MOSC domain-containing protein [Planococcus lenghuensis]
MRVGTVKEIMRHPVKSFAGEKIGSTRIMEYGLYGDRSHAFIDHNNREKYLTITQFQEMVRYQARFSGEESMDGYPEVEVETPEGRILNWTDDTLRLELERKSGRSLSPVQFTPAAVPIGAIERAPIHIVSTASIAEMERLWGEDSLDWRRFRPNLLLAFDDKTPFLEETWYGQELRIGQEAVIRLEQPCDRCMIITVDPENGNRAPSLLKTVVKERRKHFGIYASVIKTGDIQAGDPILLKEW